MANLPMAVYGLEVPAGDVAIAARPDIPAAFRITMAAIDPSAEPEMDVVGAAGKPRATLKIIRQPLLSDFLGEDDSDDESDFDEDEMNALLAEEDSDESEESDDQEDLLEGPSDPSKSKKARKAAATAQILAELNASAMDVDEAPNGVNGKSKGKGKGKGKAAVAVATVDDEEDEEDDEDEDGDDEDDDESLSSLDEPEEYVICTLDPEKLYQQPLDITIGEDERVWFKVSGTHSIYLTGNYVEPSDPTADPYDEEGLYDSEDEDEYDLTPDEDELDDEDDISEDDALDALADPRVVEVEEDEAPTLVPAKKGKGKNKRAADESADEATLDEIIAKAQEVNGDEPKLSKKQAKKLKNNAGQAVAAEKEEAAAAKSDKKVQFAEKLEQGPTPSPAASKDKTSASTGPRVVQGVTVDVKKVGEGAEAKKGDRISMRYIGKLAKDGKVFDSNKKGKPFSFKLGAGEVIKGWDIGLNGTRVGSERRLTIPAHLGYGSKGAPPDIPPNATLIFDVKCLEIKKN